MTYFLDSTRFILHVQPTVTFIPTFLAGFQIHKIFSTQLNLLLKYQTGIQTGNKLKLVERLSVLLI